MRNFFSLFPFAIALMLAATVFAQDRNQDASSTGEEARHAKILANLRFHIPPLAQVNPSIGSIEPTGIDGLEQGTLIIKGESHTFLVTSDDRKLWLLAYEPFDVSRDTAEIEAEQARQQSERREKLARIAEGEPVRGNPDGNVTIIEYSDFQCPYCTRGFQTVEEILEKYPQDVKFVFQHFPLTNIHPWAKRAAIAAECAAMQSSEAFWMLHDAYFENQGQLNAANLVARSVDFLGESGIDLVRFESCASDETSEAYKAAEAEVEAELAEGQAMGVTGTPGFFVNGQFLNGAQPITAFEPIIESARGTGPGSAAGSAGE